MTTTDQTAKRKTTMQVGLPADVAAKVEREAYERRLPVGAVLRELVTAGLSARGPQP